MATQVRFVFDKVLFFGRSIDEYRTMFNFDPEEFGGKRILDCASGPAALAAHSKELNIEVVACDPIYKMSAKELHKLADEDADLVGRMQQGTMDLFEAAVRRAKQRRIDMEAFFEDFARGKSEGRYVEGALPNLPFADKHFDLTLCGNLLFLYSDIASGGMLKNSTLDYDFHLASLRELVRVTRGGVRIYPLVAPEAAKHAYLKPICDELRRDGINSELVAVSHPDIKTATHMLVMKAVG